MRARKTYNYRLRRMDIPFAIGGRYLDESQYPSTHGGHESIANLKMSRMVRHTGFEMQERSSLRKLFGEAQKNRLWRMHKDDDFIGYETLKLKMRERRKDD